MDREKQKWLVFDFGPQFGDNFRGFLFLKALKAKHPEAELTCWITPGLRQGLGGLMDRLGFMDQWLVEERSPRQTYELNFMAIKRLTAQGLPFRLSSFPGGAGPDGVAYHKVIPNSEAWFSAKLLAGEELEAPDALNQGEFLRELFELGEKELFADWPLFGRAEPAGEHICLGLCRPSAADPKQPARSLVEKVWRAARDSGRELYCLDYQDWLDPPKLGRVHDWRQKPWSEKIEVLNQARLFIGLDGGLNHFAAACGCPTLSFYGKDLGPQAGLLVGPYPRRTPRGEHRYFGVFEDYLAEVKRALAS